MESNNKETIKTSLQELKKQGLKEQLNNLFLRQQQQAHNSKLNQRSNRYSNRYRRSRVSTGDYTRRIPGAGTRTAGRIEYTPEEMAEIDAAVSDNRPLMDVIKGKQLNRMR